MKSKRIMAMEKYIMDHGSASMEELRDHFEVSMNTVRRDVADLLKGGSIRKVYGGVRAQTQESSLLNQTWKIKETIIKFKSATYDAAGLNLNDLAAFAAKQGAAFGDEFPKDMVADKVFISDSYVGIEFKNGQTYVSPVNMNGAALAGGKVNFSLSELSDAGVDFLNGEASLQFGANVAILSVKGGIGDEAVTASLTLEII